MKIRPESASVNFHRIIFKEIMRIMPKTEILAGIAILVLLLTAGQASAGEEEYLYLNSAKLRMQIGADMKLVSLGAGSYINYVRANLSFVPRNDLNQEVEKLQVEPSPTETESGYIFTWENPEMGKLSFKVDAIVKTRHFLHKVKSKVKFPIAKNELPESARAYMKESDNIDFSSPEIVRLASEIAEGKDDLFRVVFDLADWIMNNLKYDISVGQRVESASWILENKRGVCDEYSTLFIALARALGIPARYVSGIAYSNLDIIRGFGPHAWAEVYFPGYGWVPFDFTYGELGYVDATHIKLKTSMDPSDSSTRYEWEGYMVKLETEPLDMKTEVTGKGERIKPLLRVKSRVSKEKVGFGSYNLLIVTLKNENDYYVPTRVQLTETNGLEIVGGNKKHVLLEPNSEKKIMWILKVSEALDNKFIYTFKTGAFTSRNESSYSTFQAADGEAVYSREYIEEIMNDLQEEDEKVYSDSIDLQCNAEPAEVYAGLPLNVECTIRNNGTRPVKNLRVCLGEECRETNIEIAQEEIIGFNRTFTSQESAGKKELRVKAENKFVSKTAYLLVNVEEKPDLEIENVTYPPTVNGSQKFAIEFAIRKKSKGTPKNLKVQLLQGPNRKTWKLKELERDKKFIINIDGRILAKKENKFEIVTEYEGLNGEKYETKKEFFINRTDSSLTSRILGFSGDIIGGIGKEAGNIGENLLSWQAVAASIIIFIIITSIIIGNRNKRELW